MRATWRVLGAAAAAVSTFILTGPGVAAAGTSWPTYHGDNSRSGVDSTEPALSPLSPAWANLLDGAAVYGQPVVAAGRVFVATEDDDVYALDAHDGHVLWAANIGQPLRNVSSQVGCGDIDPLGITSTPVVDLATGTLYVAGEVSSGGSLPVHHQLVGFDIYTGAETLSTTADPVLPAGETTGDLKYLQQRAALAVGNDRVYVAYGGLDGDCGNYHGWVVGIAEGGNAPAVQFDPTPGGSDGAIWNGGGGPSLDASGNVYVVTGNGNGAYADSVVKLSPTLGVEASYLDQAAGNNGSGDADLGTGDALLLPDGDLFTVGKTDRGFLLAQSNLSPVAVIPNVCGSDPDGGATYDAGNNSVYVPCSGGGIQQVNLTTRALGARVGSVNSSPILVDGTLWALGYNNGDLQQIDPGTGSATTMVANLPLPHFATPSAADGLLLFGTTHGVRAYAGPSGPPAPPPPPPPPTGGYRLMASDGGVFSFGTSGFAGSLGGVHLVAPIVGAASTGDGRGYWLVGADGGVFTFGDARFYGSTGGVRLRQPVVAMAADLAAGGYWLVAADGGVFSFNAPFLGSLGGVRLGRPIVGTASAAGGNGYWMVASDGGVFTFGPGAGFAGSAYGVALSAPIVGMAVDAATGGYWLAAADGGILSYDAPFNGSVGGHPLVRPVVAITEP